jgi:hypothetical protein
MTHLSTLHMTLQLFYRRQNENLQAWIGLAKEVLTLARISRDLWASLVVQHLQDAAMTWYISKKRENNNTVLTWDEMEATMEEQWNNPARINELHMHLHTLKN